MKLTKKEISQRANKASWLNPEAKKKSMALGRAKTYKARREAGHNSFTDNHRDTLKIKKFEQYHNYLAIYLIENKITSNRLFKITKKLNTPNFYTSDLKLKQAIENFVFDANKEREGFDVTYEVACELINKSLTIKTKLFPNQIAPIRARERKKERRKTIQVNRKA